MFYGRGRGSIINITLNMTPQSTIYVKTLETTLTNIQFIKLLNIDKTNFVSPPHPPPQFIVNDAETTFGNIP